MQQSAASQRVWSDGTLQLEIQEVDLIDAPLLRGVVRFCRMHVIARGVCTHMCTHTVLGALPTTRDVVARGGARDKREVSGPGGRDT